MGVDAEEGWETAPETDSEESYSKSTSKSLSKGNANPKSKASIEVGLDCIDIKEVLEDNPGLKFGFVIYRCTYSKQADWDRFMKRLNERTRLNLRDEGVEHLFDRIDWCVQEDPELSHASAANVRKRFKKRIEESEESKHWLGTARFMACVMVDKYDLQSVLNGPRPSEFDTFGDAYVTLVSLDKSEGDMSVGLSYLVPRVYSLLEAPGWDNFAVDQDDVACP